MEGFVGYVAAALADRPERVTVTHRDDDRLARFELRLDPGDIGAVIGKGGRTIKAMRLLLAAARKGLPAELEIIE
ncbi:MAG: KH domain-containing protein [Candidatus Aureabacteria bacterium]|jgi:predicted RNA-binding protein YlqC (UPF0109 family)|nr:KH domain-containing protein [Candidatus Auribacterota bacterium]NLW94434.1 KH domain-containing protein [Chlamydiota bacterium]HOE28290.1 KH domain-containing protein [bacterium]HQM53753.1 KH domain-containing protein [bacterium]